MLKCEDCGAEFDKPFRGTDEEKDSCPNCGSWAIREAEICQCCGEHYIRYYLPICNNCRDQFHKAVDMLIGEYTNVLKMDVDGVEDLLQDHIMDRFIKRRKGAMRNGNN